MGDTLASEDALSGFRAWIVPHTHWDREWYLPFEQMRIRLVRMLDELVSAMDADPRIRHFTLDGHSVLLEDCAELRTDIVDRLRALADAGRLSVGPLYLLSDELLPGPESLVRNMLLGQAVAREFGFEPMALGYSPDPFGHLAQLPQILAGFGFTDFLFRRGLGDAADTLGAAFWWEAPDGTRVLAHRLLGGYHNAARLGSSDGAVADAPLRFLTRYRDTLGRSATRDLLMCNGDDHASLQHDIADVVETIAAAHPGLAVEISGYEAYVAAVREALPGDLATYGGELVESRDQPILRGVNSARMPLKQAYGTSEELLLTAESAAALASLRTGATYPSAELRHAWRELLRNSPHDSVSGCSVDETHRHMVARFARADQIARRIRREAIAALAGRTAVWSHGEPVSDAYSVLNLLPWSRHELAELRLPPTSAADDLVLREGELYWSWWDKPGRETRIKPFPGESLVAVAGGASRPVQPSRSNPGTAWVDLDLPSYGATTVRLAGAGQQADPRGRVRVIGRRRLENDLLAVEIRDDGGLVIEDLATGRTWTGLNVFEDVADRGDEYTFCPVERDVPITSLGTLGATRVLESGPLVAEIALDLALRLPRALARDRRGRSRATVTCRVQTRVRLVAGSRRVEFRTSFDNRARDHRLRVLVPTRERQQTVLAETGYQLIERSARPTSAGIGWCDPPSPTQHTRGVVAAGEMALAGRGLPEYEALESKDGLVLALTLLRCIGWVSRDDLTTRTSGYTGPLLKVPDAQCLGERRFEYAIWVGAADPIERLRASAEWRRPLVAGEPGVADGSLFPVGGHGFAEGALKGAQDGNGMVFRVFAGPAGAQIDLPADLTFVTCRLDEQPATEPTQNPNHLGPARIASWRIGPAPRPLSG